MLQITQFNFTEDLMAIEMVLTSTSVIDSLIMYIGDGYISDPIDLSARLSPPLTDYVFTGSSAITATDLGLPEGTPLSGVFIAVATNTDSGSPETTEEGIMSDYQLTLCMANKIIKQNHEDDLNETTFLFLLIEAAKVYMTEKQFEQAIGAYERAYSLCANDPENFNTDILPCGEGTGCWIIDGVYIVKK